MTAFLRAEPVEQTLFWLFAAGLAWVPFWYGSNDWLAWGVNAIVFPGLCAAYELSLLIRGKAHPVAISFLALPAVLFLVVVLWIALQMVILPHGWLANSIWAISGQTVGKRLEGSISVNRDLTMLALIRLITAASSFWLALQLCREGQRANLLLIAIGGIIVAYATYGIMALQFGQLPELPYLFLAANAGKLSSTFINPDSFATFAAMGLIVTASLMLHYYGHGLRAAAGNLRLQVAFFIERTGGFGAALVVGGFILIAALVLTDSRGGIVAAAWGLLVLGLMALCRRNQAKVPPVVLVVGFVFWVATLFAFGEVIGAKIQQGGFYDENRFAVYNLTLRSIFNEPVLGYGYGTFIDVFPLYRDRSIGVFGTWQEAHNTYLELFQGLGVIVGAMLILCILLIVFKCLRGAVKRQRDVTAPSVAVGVACVAASHALVDFSLQIQAVAVTLMALIGAGVAQSASSRQALED